MFNFKMIDTMFEESSEDFQKRMEKEQQVRKVKEVVDAYEYIMKYNSPIDDIIHNGNETDFKYWLAQSEKSDELLDYFEDTLIPKLIQAELYEWVVLVKNSIK